MIRVYYLPVVSTDSGDEVLGQGIIHDAILDATEQPNVRKLIMDTSNLEHDSLTQIAVSHRQPTSAELDAYNALPVQLEAITFHPEDPVLGVEQRLTHVEDFLHTIYPP